MPQCLPVNVRMTHFVDMLKTRGARLAFGAAKDASVRKALNSRKLSLQLFKLRS